MVHLSLSDMPRDFDKKFQLNRVDWFESNSFALKQAIFTKEDTVVVRDILEAMSIKLKLEIVAAGSGIGKFENDGLVKHPQPLEEMAYPGTTAEERTAAAEEETYKLLRQTMLSIDIRESIAIEVNAFTDPVRTNFLPNSETLKKLLAQGKISNNEALSVYRTMAVLLALKQELIYYAGEYLDREKASQVIDYLDVEFKKIKINVGTASIRIVDL